MAEGVDRWGGGVLQWEVRKGGRLEMARGGNKSFAYMVVAIVLGVLNCVCSVKGVGAFGIVISIVLLAMLSVGLGYVYSRHEAELEAEKAEGEKAKSALRKAFGEDVRESENEESEDGE